MKKIKVNLSENSYSIFIGRFLINELCNSLKRLKLGNLPVIITNPRINALIGSNLRGAIVKSGFKSVKTCIIPDSEKSKSLDTATRVIKFLVKTENFKNPFIIALGGGVVGDLAGFVASVYKRGLPYINIPTTLLSQVDSSIGGKVAIDIREGKNLIVSFYQPKFVLLDLSFLKSLPTRHIKSGIGEVIKYGVICDRGLFEYLERNYAGILKLKPDDIERIIYKSVLIKSRIVEEDEKEKKGLRTILNFGHTIGHALEAATDYSGPYSHGEAVSFGMVCAADISERLGFCSSELKVRLESLLSVFGLPTAIKKVNINKLMKSIILDKKFIHGKTRFVLPVKIGEVKVVEDVPLRMIEGVIKERRRL